MVDSNYMLGASTSYGENHAKMVAGLGLHREKRVQLHTELDKLKKAGQDKRKKFFDHQELKKGVQEKNTARNKTIVTVPLFVLALSGCHPEFTRDFWQSPSAREMVLYILELCCLDHEFLQRVSQAWPGNGKRFSEWHTIV